ncbi:MAG: flagellin FliC, partial [Alphaproteobacteria bacterium]|nr:flagellin FliC [Alphaproteobacteria bacterium]
LGSVGVSGASTVAAVAAIDAVDVFTKSISTLRAAFGSVTNRLQLSVANTASIRTNIAAANSAIRDVDIAEETAQLARTQVLLTAGASVLSQANQSPQLALQLLSR